MKVNRVRHGKTRQTSKVVAENVTPWFVFSGVNSPGGTFQIRTREATGEQYNIELSYAEAQALQKRLTEFFSWAGLVT